MTSSPTFTFQLPKDLDRVTRNKIRGYPDAKYDGKTGKWEFRSQDLQDLSNDLLSSHPVFAGLLLTSPRFDAARNYVEPIVALWESGMEGSWKKWLRYYWEFIKKQRYSLELEIYIDELDAEIVKKMPTKEFYEFLWHCYFPWKFGSSREFLCKNRNEKLKLHECGDGFDKLNEIKSKLFDFDKNDIGEGLKIASEIHGLGVVAASGLLAVLFPNYFGTIDRFAV